MPSRRLVFTELDYQSARPRKWTERGETMKITRNTVETTPGPADWFTGSVFIDRLAVPSNLSALGAASVHFTPGARTAWHTHPHGQTIWIAEGVGLCQREGGPIEVIRPGDCVFFEPGENHWHGATPTRFMTHIAMQLADETGSSVSWGRHVSEDEYNQAPGLEEGDN
jgi:quercetin dioxygenase-like cupin family protein